MMRDAAGDMGERATARCVRQRAPSAGGLLLVLLAAAVAACKQPGGAGACMRDGGMEGGSGVGEGGAPHQAGWRPAVSGTAG